MRRPLLLDHLFFQSVERIRSRLRVYRWNVPQVQLHQAPAGEVKGVVSKSQVLHAGGLVRKTYSVARRFRPLAPSPVRPLSS
jgi:hypothetical protein